MCIGHLFEIKIKKEKFGVINTNFLLIIKRKSIIAVEIDYEKNPMFTKVCKKRESLLTLEILLLIIANPVWQLPIER